MMPVVDTAGRCWGAFSLNATRFAVLSVLFVALTGCETIQEWTGGPKDEPLPGERISVISLESELEVDERIRDLDVTLPPPYANVSWTQPGGYANNVLHHLAAPGNLDVLWRASAGSGSGGDARLLATPVIADGKLFVMDAESHVSAMNAETGERLWTTRVSPEGEDPEEGLGGGIAYEAGRLYVSTGFGTVLSLDAETGESIWVIQPGIPFRAAPTVDGGRIFVSTYDNQMHAFSAEDGREIWSHRGIAEAAGILNSTSAAVSGSTVIAPYSSGELVAIRVENGNVIWSDSLTRTGNLTSLSELNEIAGRPVVDRGRVFAASHSGRMVSIDLRTGERVWARNIASIQMPWVAGEFIYVVTTNAEVLCIWRRDGRIRWLTQLARYEDEEDREDPIKWSGPVLVGDRLVLLSSVGTAIALSPYSGDLLGIVEIPDGAFVPPIVANETLYILTDSADVIALR